MKNIYKVIIFLLLLFFPLNVFAENINIDIVSTKALLVNLNDNKFLYEKNINTKTKIASLTKIMTAIIVLENVSDLQEKVLLTNEDFQNLYEIGAATSGFKVNNYYTYEELLYGLLLPSGADCANALVRVVSETKSNFIEMMNEKAKQLGMNNTNFTNATGLDEENNYSTAYDVYLMYKYALSNETFKKITETMEYKVNDITLNHSINYYVKKFDLAMDYLLGGKTGTEDLAGYCLATTATYNNVDYMLITLNAPYSYTTPYHFYDTKKIYEYFMNNYSYQTLINKNDLIKIIDTKSVKEENLKIYASKDYSYYLENDYDEEKISYIYEGLNSVSYNIKKDTTIGVLSIYYDEELLDKIDITLNEKLHFSIINFYKDDSIALYTLVFLSLVAFFIYLKSNKSDDIEFNFE